MFTLQKGKLNSKKDLLDKSNLSSVASIEEIYKKPAKTKFNQFLPAHQHQQQEIEPATDSVDDASYYSDYDDSDQYSGGTSDD